MPTFEEFVQTELPLRPFVSSDGTPGQVLIRSNNPLAVRELIWGTPSGEAEQSYTAGDTIGGHRVVIMTAPGTIGYADNTDPTHASRIIGLTKQAGAIGAAITVAKQGAEVVEPTWTWTTGQVVYLGTNGTLIQSEPVLPAAFSLIVGFATSPTTIFIDVREPIFLA